MTTTPEAAVEENRRLRGTMRDLIALSTLPAIWIGLAPEGIARSLADVLLDMLPLDLVYVRLSGPRDDAAVEVFRNRTREATTTAADLGAVRASLAPLLSPKRAQALEAITDPFGGGTLRIAVTRFGIGEEQGVLIGGSHRADFPMERDRLLLGVGANQTATVMQRQRADEQLHERQEWLRVTLSSIGDAVIATDIHGGIVFLNSVAQDLTGWTADEAQGKPLATVFAIVNEETRQRVESPVEKVLKEDRIVGLANHTVLISKDGTERPIDDSAAPIRDPHGKMIGVVLIFRDVTEQRHAARELRLTAARKSAVLETALDCIITMDHEGKVVEFNPAAERTFGYDREQASGRDLAELIIPPAMREQHRRGMRHYFATGEGPILGKRLELVAMRADGTEFPVELAVNRIPMDGPPLFTAYARDIGERKQSERHRNVRLGVTQVLTQAATVSDAVTGILQAICESLSWDLGLFWMRDRSSDSLQLQQSWQALNSMAPQLIAASRSCAFRRGEGLPGHAWAIGEPCWLPNVTEAPNFPRAAAAAQEGLNSAFACPLVLGGKTLAVVEFFSRQIQQPDSGLLETIATTTGLIGQFIERKQAEEGLRRSEARFRGLMEQAPFSIQLFSPDGRTIQVNRAWENLWGVTLEQIGAYNVLEDQQLEAKGVRRYIQQGFAGHAARIPAIQYDPNDTIPDITQADDSRRWLSAVIYPLKDAEGTVREVALIHEDITARARAEEALHESRERLDLALHAADLGHWAMRLPNGKTTRNPRHDQIFGYDDVLPEWSYEIFLEHVLPEDRAVVDANFQRALSSKTLWDSECRIRRADGSVRWIWTRGRVFKDGADEGSRMAGTVADITERKEGEEELRHARARLEAALEAGAIATWTWDIPNNKLFADEFLARLFDLDPADATGGVLDRHVESIHADDRPRVIAALNQAVESGEVYEADYRIVQPDGSVRWVVARGRAERDANGQPARMPGVLIDITERKRLEYELQARVMQLAEADRAKEDLLFSLQQSEEKLRLMADTIPQLAWMARPDGNIFWFNRRWYDYTGTRPEDVEGWSWQTVHDPDVLPKVLARWNESIVSGQPFDMVFPLRGADGTFRPFLTRVNPLKNQDSTILYWFGTNTDISEIKRMEEALRNTDRRKDEFLATLAHELRNPLAPIRNALQILNTPQIDAATAQRTKAMMERQVHQLVRLVDDLLDVSRVTGGKIELRRERVELATVIARAVETAQPLIEARNHELHLSLPEGALLVDADPVRLSQVVGNLLTNAAKYTEQGGRITVSAEQEGEHAVVRVIDDGIGIDVGMLPHIFDLFMQVDHATTRSEGGLGIGLTLVRNLMEMHGGTIEAHSGGLGKGCEFVARMPLLTRQPPEAKESDAQGPGPKAAPLRYRLLVVDDNQDAALTLAMLLELKGHEVRVVHDGASALDAVSSLAPTLVFLDIGMPEMDGYEVARRIRRIPGAQTTVLAALTGWGQQEDRRRTAEAGFDHHLVKPVEVAAIEELLANLQREQGH